MRRRSGAVGRERSRTRDNANELSDRIGPAVGPGADRNFGCRLCRRDGDGVERARPAAAEAGPQTAGGRPETGASRATCGAATAAGSPVSKPAQQSSHS